MFWGGVEVGVCEMLSICFGGLNTDWRVFSNKSLGRCVNARYDDLSGNENGE